jgi:hypothetical protein
MPIVTAAPLVMSEVQRAELTRMAASTVLAHRIAKGRGRKSWLPPGTVAEVRRLTRTQLPADGSTHSATRSLAARVGIGKDAVARIWADHHLKPWKVQTFKVSNDPRFEDKLVDVVGL